MINGETSDRSMGQEKHESGERRQIERKRISEGSFYCIQYLVSDTAILFCPYNHSQQLEVRADRTSTYPGNPSEEEGNDYKRGVKRKKEGIPSPPQQSSGIRKGSSDQSEDKMVVIHEPKPSSLAHSLQIHCNGLTGLRTRSS